MPPLSCVDALRNGWKGREKAWGWAGGQEGREGLFFSSFALYCAIKAALQKNEEGRKERTGQVKQRHTITRIK